MYGYDTRVLGNPKEIKIKSVAANIEVKFLAFLTGFNDTYTSNWDRDSVYGRQDPITTFKNTQRTVQFSIVVVSSSIQEARHNFQKINALQRMLYPRYKTITKTGDDVISTSPLVGILFYPLITEFLYDDKRQEDESYIGNYDYLYGTIDTISMSPLVESGFVFSGSGAPLPKEYNLDITLNVIHRNKLGWDSSGENGDGRSEFTQKYGNDYKIKKAFRGK